MNPRSALTLLFLLTYASSILQIRGNQMSKGAYMPEHRLGNSPLNSSMCTGDPSQLYTHFASYSRTGNMLGVRAMVTVWEIADVQPLSSSAAYIGANNFEDKGNDRIIAGVLVYPGLYHDNDLRFFTYWSSGNNGCYNLNCPGFVVADGANLSPGQALAPPLSIYAGPERYITIRIKKDQKTGDWSLYREDQGGPIGGMTLLGWWPKTLFAGLSDHATIVEWTGAIFHPESERSPSMGSGHFSDEFEKKAASFKQITVFDVWEGRFRPAPYEVTPYMDRKECYNVSSFYDTQNSDGTHFFYGGPGGCIEK